MAESDPGSATADSGTSRILNDLNMSIIVARDVYARLLVSSRIVTLDDDRHTFPLPQSLLYICMYTQHARK